MTRRHGLAALLLAPLLAAQAEQAELVALRDEKLRAAFLAKSGWVTSFAAAKQRARASGRPILIYFTRSFSPSPPCEALERDVFAAEGFAEHAARVVPFCHVTSKVEGDPDQDLLTRLGGEAFPHVVVTDDEGRAIATFRGERTLQGLLALLGGEVAEFIRLRDAAAKGSKPAQAQFFLQRLRLGHVPPAEVQATLDANDFLSDADEAAVRRSLASLELMEILAGIDDEDPASSQRAAERILAMKRAGRVPSGRMEFAYWHTLLLHADRAEDVELFGEALERIKELPGERDAKWVLKMDNRLRAMRFMKDREKGR